MIGGAGNDTFNNVNFADGDTILGGAGDDIVSFDVQPGDLNIDLAALEIERINVGGVGDDLFDGTGVTGIRVTVNAGTGDDTILGSAQNDTLVGQDGDDLIEGNAGTDRLDGQFGNDTIRGGDGNDTIYGDFRLTTTCLLYTSPSPRD